MSIRRWAYDPKRCDGDFCPQDCDYCNKAEEIEFDEGICLAEEGEADE